MKTNINKEFSEEIMQKTINEKYLVENLQRSIELRPEYMNRLSRNEVNLIFSYRTRMTKAKANYKGLYKNTKCRWCAEEEETQDHLMTECKEFPKTSAGIKTKEIFNEEIKELKKICPTLEKFNEELKPEET